MLHSGAGVRDAQRGITGLETSIVLIAFVVVASVFAFTVLSAGVFSSEAAKQTIFAGLKETRARIRQNGSVFAFSAKETSTPAVYKIVFIVSNSLAGEPMDLTPPYTADDSGLDPDFDAAAVPATIVSYADEDQRLGDVPWSVQFIGNNNGDLLLEDGEKAEVTVWLLDRVTGVAETDDSSAQFMDDDTGNGGGAGGITSAGVPVGKSTRFVVEMTPQFGSALTVQRAIPPGLRPVMNLN
jgi:flagellin FlaB